MKQNWIKRPYVDVGRDEQGLYVNRGWEVRNTVPLSNGQRMRLSFSLHRFAECEEIHVHLVVFNRFAPPWNRWSKEGSPTGPGGTEVFGRLSTLFFEGLDASDNLFKRRRQHREIVIWGSTDTLFNIYRKRLTRRGFILDGDVLYKVV